MERKTIEQAIEATRKILAAHDLHYKDAEILYCSNNLVLHLRPLSVVAKVVAAGEGPAIDKNLELSVAHHLQRMGVPCVAPLAALPIQVYAKDGFQVTFWEYFKGEMIEVPDRNKSLDLIQKLHAALSSFHYENLPRFEIKLDDCIGSLERTSLEMSGLSAKDRLFLFRVLRELKARLNGPSTKLGIIHGDCRSHNLIWNDQGMAKWVDFEAVCLGPIAWDYISFFGVKDEVLHPYSNTVELLSDIATGCAATRCWMKKNRKPPVQKAADHHLQELKRKYASI